MTTLYPRAEVFAVAEWAQRQRRPASIAVAAHFGVTTAHAKTLIRDTRRRGYLAQHTASAHHRAPTTIERTPTGNDVAA